MSITNRKKNKIVTNDVAFKNLLKNLDSVQTALLRERVLYIAEQTAKDCVNWGENSFVNPTLYIKLNEVVQEHLGFND